MDDVPPGKLPDENGGKDKGDDDVDGDKKEYRAGNCNDCNRQFCLDYNLPICRGAGMEDVFTTCFREFTYFELRRGWSNQAENGEGRDGLMRGTGRRMLERI